MIEVQEMDDGWYFWELTGTFSYGPYPSRAEAERALATYLCVEDAEEWEWHEDDDK